MLPHRNIVRGAGRSPRSSASLDVAVRAGERQPQSDHAEPEGEVQPVVGVVERHEVRIALGVDGQPVDPQDQVDQPAADQERAGRKTAATAAATFCSVVAVMLPVVMSVTGPRYPVRRR